MAHFGEHYNMKPPFVVIRRVIDGPTDQADIEWYCGHRAAWIPWRKPRPIWEKYHLAIHDGLCRFHTEIEAKAYVMQHNDMTGELFEYVHVTVSEMKR